MDNTRGGHHNVFFSKNRRNAAITGKVQVPDVEITSWLVSAYDFYSRVVKDR